ncbi:hypothetical protein LBMAG56_38450 [Verrucomicrobiota bacterium]|nr:hypothetical protein LBMAG56_38450 [Verrucomicrobiota bacterium]
MQHGAGEHERAGEIAAVRAVEILGREVVEALAGGGVGHHREAVRDAARGALLGDETLDGGGVIRIQRGRRDVGRKAGVGDHAVGAVLEVGAEYAGLHGREQRDDRAAEIARAADNPKVALGEIEEGWRGREHAGGRVSGMMRVVN